MLKATLRYQGPVQAIILDWAGTTIDFGSLAPVRAFIELFKREGVHVTQAQAREPMGTEKRVHITRMLSNTNIQQQWETIKGAAHTQADIDRLYDDFLPIQTNIIKQRSQLIPGWKNAFDELVNKGYKIGGNTGYAREMVEPALTLAKEQGYTPLTTICATEVKRGRPMPDMALMTMLELGADHVHACVKVDDTLPGIEEGIRAGMWTVGVAVSGNEVGLDEHEWNALSDKEKQPLKDKSYARFNAQGAHIVIDSVSQLPQAIATIETWIAQGITP
jgi:phosphonoacetaldehyde hydrolase